MSLRSLLKVPRYGLFYFESDKTVSVLPSNKVKKVMQGDNTSKGSIVEVCYGKDLLTAEIIAVDGKSCLTMHVFSLLYCNWIAMFLTLYNFQGVTKVTKENFWTYPSILKSFCSHLLHVFTLLSILQISTLWLFRAVVVQLFLKYLHACI